MEDSTSSKMLKGGHTEHFRVTVFMRILGKYENNLTNHLQKKKLMYRNRPEREKHFNENGRSTKSKWFRKTNHTSTVTFPTTPGDGLVNRVRTCLEKCIPPKKTFTKVLGGGGISIKATLMKANPTPRMTCGRPNCPLMWMEVGCKDRCYREMVGYSGHCTGKTPNWSD